MKIMMLVPVYRRPEILQVFIRHMQRTRPPYADLRPVFIISAEDPEFEQILWQVRNYDHLIYKNTPLGEKMNAGLHFARRFDWQFMMNIGSDNIWTMLLWRLYEPYFKTRTLFGINDFHAYNYQAKQCKLIRNYNTGFDDRPAPIGAGRMIARDLLAGIDELWRPEWNWGMDGASLWTLWERGYRCDVVDTHGEAVMLNIMTRTNLTQWEELKGGTDVNYFDMRAAFGMDDAVVVDLDDWQVFDKEVARRSLRYGTRRRAFESVNEEYRSQHGEYRYKNFESFTTAAYKRRNKI